MPKTSSHRKRGIQRSIPRHQIRSKVVHENERESTEPRNSRFLSVSCLGKKCFEFTQAACEKFHLIGFTCTPNGKYVPLNRKGYIWHATTVALSLALCMYKMWIAIRQFHLGMQSFMCLCWALVPMVAAVVGLAAVLRPKETIDVLNSWSCIGSSLKKINPSSKFHPADNISGCLKSVAGTMICIVAIPLAVAQMSLIMNDLPICLFPMAKGLGLLPEGIVPDLAWQITFAPLEWLMAMPFMLLAALSGSILFLEIGALNLYLQQIRTVNPYSIKSRRSLERMYVELELFNRIAQVWTRLYLPPWLFALAISVIVTVFITIRFTELPLIFYVIFPYTGFTLMLQISWLSYDMLNVIRASEDTLGKLRQLEAPYFRGLTRAKRVVRMKRAKAMRPVVFSLADSEFSLGLPFSIWEEVINQVLFLLSL